MLVMDFTIPISHFDPKKVKLDQIKSCPLRKTISFAYEEDMEKELRISQIEAKIKALTVNFSKRYKDSSIQIFKINKSSSTKDELSF